MFVEAKLVKEIARIAGFDICGISAATVDGENIQIFEKWLSRGCHADMQYLSKNKHLRFNPNLVLNNIESVISLGLNYNNPNYTGNAVSMYAQGTDYHIIIKEMLKHFQSLLHQKYPEIESLGFVDTAPVLERYFAYKGGLGFVGKNTCIINEKFGSYVFLAEIFTNFVSDTDKPSTKSCGECCLCVEACPTQALGENGLDANKCISYHTIESRKEVPQEIEKQITHQVFGCDICQKVCPHNQIVPITKVHEFKNHPALQNIELSYLESLSNSQFKKIFGNSPLFRPGKNKLINNIKCVIRNQE